MDQLADLQHQLSSTQSEVGHVAQEKAQMQDQLNRVEQDRLLAENKFQQLEKDRAERAAQEQLSFRAGAE